MSRPALPAGAPHPRAARAPITFAAGRAKPVSADCRRSSSQASHPPGRWSRPIRASAAVEDIVAEIFHLEDGGVRAPDDRLGQVGLDDLADDDVMVALLDDAGNAAFNRCRGRIEDRRSGGALVNGEAAQLTVFQFGRLEEGEGSSLLLLAEHV